MNVKATETEKRRTKQTAKEQKTSDKTKTQWTLENKDRKRNTRLEALS